MQNNLLIYKISSTCFGQYFAHHQERETEIFQHMVSCPVVVGRGSESSPNPCPPQQDTIPYAVKISVLRSWRWAEDCPKHVELILYIDKLLLLHLVGSSILLYLHWWCTVKHKSSSQNVIKALYKL